MLIRYFRDQQESIKDRWAKGVFTHQSLEAGYQLNIEAISKAQFLGELETLTYQDIEAFYDSQHVETESRSG